MKQSFVELPDGTVAVAFVQDGDVAVNIMRDIHSFDAPAKQHECFADYTLEELFMQHRDIVDDNIPEEDLNDEPEYWDTLRIDLEQEISYRLANR